MKLKNVFCINFILIHFFLFFSEVRGQKVESLGKSVTNSKIQSGDFLITNNKIYVSTVLRTGSSFLFRVIEVESGKELFNYTFENIKGAWQVVGDGNSFYIAAESGTLYSYTLGNNSIKTLGKPYNSERPIVSLTAHEGLVFGGTYPNGYMFGFNSRSNNFIYKKNEPVFKNEKYVRSIAYSKSKNSVFAGIGANAHLIKYDLNTGRKSELIHDILKNYSFVFDLKLVKIKNIEYLFGKVVGGAKRETFIYNINSNNSSGIFEGIDVQSALGYQNDLYYTQSANLYKASIGENNKINNRIKIGYTHNTSIASKIFNNKIYLLNTSGEVLDFDLNTNKKSSSNVTRKSSYSNINTFNIDSKGIIWSGGFLSGGNSLINIKTKESKSLEGLDQSETIVDFDNYVYFGTYPKARIFAYNKNQPWNLSKSNPKLIGSIEGQDRLITSLKIQNSKLIYFGSVPTYGKLGGRLVKLDVSTNTIQTFRPINNQSIVSLCELNNDLFIGTSISGGLGSRPITKNGSLIIWDIKRSMVKYNIIPVPGEIAVTALQKLNHGKILGMAGGTLFLFNPETNKVEKKIKIYKASSKTDLTKDASILYHNGVIYISGNNDLYSVNYKTWQLKKVMSGVKEIRKHGSKLFYIKGEEILSLEL